MEKSQQVNKVLLTTPFHPVMNHFYPNQNVPFQDDSAHIYRTRGLTEWFHEDEYLNFVEQPVDILVQHIYPHHQNTKEIYFESTVFITPEQIHRLVESISWST